MNWKEIEYWSSYLIPGVPTYHLIREYKKPKEKRNSTKIFAGYLSTAFLATKLVLIAGGIVTFNNLEKFKSTKEIPECKKSLEEKVDSTYHFSDEKNYFKN